MIENLKIIDENFIKESADTMIRFGELNNAFSDLLKASFVFRTAGMTPMFLFNESENTLRCVAKETFLKKLH